jgi:hypothetical protein
MLFLLDPEVKAWVDSEEDLHIPDLKCIENLSGNYKKLLEIRQHYIDRISELNVRISNNDDECGKSPKSFALFVDQIIRILVHFRNIYYVNKIATPLISYAESCRDSLNDKIDETNQLIQDIRTLYKTGMSTEPDSAEMCWKILLRLWSQTALGEERKPT